MGSTIWKVRVTSHSSTRILEELYKGQLTEERLACNDLKTQLRAITQDCTKWMTLYCKAMDELSKYD